MATEPDPKETPTPIVAPPPAVDAASTERTYTAAQVKAKLAGQGKVLTAKEQEIADLTAKLAEAQGTTDELHAKTREELATTKAERDALVAANEARVTALKASLGERVGKLPENLRILPEGMIDSAPDMAADLIGKLEQQAGTLAAMASAAGSGAAPGDGPKTAAAEAEETKARNLAAYLPKKKGA